MMEMNEKTLDYLEQAIPELAQAATKQAYWQALTSGRSVLVSDNGVIKEMFPDGTSRVIEKVAPWVKVQKGKTIIKSTTAG